jgi:uncharacterized protein (TIGR03067 family)
MQRLVLTLLLVGTAVAADQPKDDASKKDLEKMQGDWAAVSMVVNGQVLPDDDAQALFRTVKGNDYTVFRFSAARGKGTFTIDATKKPRTIDFQPMSPKDKLPPMLGIYEFDGDKLKMCYASPGKDRPTTFDAKEGSGHTCIVWMREKK